MKMRKQGLKIESNWNEESRKIIKELNPKTDDYMELRVLMLIGEEWISRNEITKNYYKKYLEKEFNGHGMPTFLKKIINDFDVRGWILHRDFIIKEVTQPSSLGKIYSTRRRINNVIKINSKKLFNDYEIFRERLMEPTIFRTLLQLKIKKRS